MLSVCEYDKHRHLLNREIADFVGHGPVSVGRKPQLLSICEYLDNIQTSGVAVRLSPNNTSTITMVVESEYIDRDFMEDYASYHSRSFYSYSRYCRRIHFFCSKFTEREFLSFLSDGKQKNSKELISSKSYLGFIIIKPLPQTYLGRVCLRYFPKNRKNFKEVINGRRYRVSLFGLPLVIDNAIAFQEQDKVVAACATTALWSSFHANVEIANNALPSPSKITQVAVTGVQTRNRMFPSGGLDAHMMGHAIKGLGLEPFNISLQKWNHKCERELYHAVSGYMSKGLGPAVLGMSVYEKAKSGDFTEKIGSHAVSVVGMRYRFGKKSDNLSGRFDADEIESLIVHDDNLGPYLTLKQSSEYHPDYGMSLFEYDLSGNDKLCNNRRYKPEFLLHNVYHKIRINVSEVEKWLRDYSDLVSYYCEKLITEQNFQFSFLQNGHNETLPPTFNWSVSLCTVSNIKESLRKEFKTNKPVASESVQSILTEHWPKYIWRAHGTVEGTSVLDILFDATDLNQGRVLLRVIPYAEKLDEFHRYLCSKFIEVADPVGQEEVTEFLSRLTQYIVEVDEKAYSLDSTYGRALMPSYMRQGDTDIDGYISAIQKAQVRFGFKPCFEDFREIVKEKNKTLLWIIDSFGALIIGIEQETLPETNEPTGGHPCLVGAARGRIAGEILWEEDETTQDKEWLINTASGRFVRDKPKHTYEQFKNAVDRIETILKKLTPEVGISTQFEKDGEKKQLKSGISS